MQHLQLDDDKKVPFIDGINTEDVDELGNPILFRAEFDDKWIMYKFWFTFLMCLISIWLWPFFLIFFPAFLYYFKTYYAAKRCWLSKLGINYSYGFFVCCCCCWFEHNKFVPLEKITDVGYEQGCLERIYGLSTLNIQTAGQSSPNEGGRFYEIQLQGIVDAKQFRRIVLKARSELVTSGTITRAALDTGAATETKREAQPLINDHDVLVDINTHLSNIEGTVSRIANKL